MKRPAAKIILLTLIGMPVAATALAAGIWIGSKPKTQRVVQKLVAATDPAVFSSVVKQTLPFDPTTLSGIYNVVIDPDDPNREAQDLRLAFNIQPKSGSNIPLEVSMIDAKGVSFKAQTSNARLGSSPASIEFVFTCQTFFDVYEFQGTLSANNTRGTYSETLDITGFSGRPIPRPGTFKGQKIF